MLDHYHELVGTLSEAEAALLDEHAQELVRVFRSGHKRLNWNSLGNAPRPFLPAARRRVWSATVSVCVGVNSYVGGVTSPVAWWTSPQGFGGP